MIWKRVVNPLAVLIKRLRCCENLSLDGVLTVCFYHVTCMYFLCSLIHDSFKPRNNCLRALRLVHVCCFSDIFIYFFNKVFTNDSSLRFCRITLSAFRIFVTWFKTIVNKRETSFIKFDIMNFNQSISKELLTNPIDYAKSIITTEKEVTNLPCPQITFI